jgi:hypothetical protein
MGRIKTCNRTQYRFPGARALGLAIADRTFALELRREILRGGADVAATKEMALELFQATNLNLVETDPLGQLYRQEFAVLDYFPIPPDWNDNQWELFQLYYFQSLDPSQAATLVGQVSADQAAELVRISQAQFKAQQSGAEPPKERVETDVQMVMIEGKILEPLNCRDRAKFFQLQDLAWEILRESWLGQVAGCQGGQFNGVKSVQYGIDFIPEFSIVVEACLTLHGLDYGILDSHQVYELLFRSDHGPGLLTLLEINGSQPSHQAPQPQTKVDEPYAYQLGQLLRYGTSPRDAQALLGSINLRQLHQIVEVLNTKPDRREGYQSPLSDQEKWDRMKKLYADREKRRSS